MKLKDLKENPKNPRFIEDGEFNLLVSSLRKFPEMMALRPCIIDDDTDYILGGNMRFKGIKFILANPREGDESLWNEIRRTGELPAEWTKVAFGLSEDQKREFVIKDNSNFGKWNWDELANEWDAEKLEEWGVRIPDFSSGEGKEGEGEGSQEGQENKQQTFIVKVVCKDIAEQNRTLNELNNLGYICEI